MTPLNLQQCQTGDPLPPLSLIHLLRSSPLLSQTPLPQLPDYLDYLLLLPTLQYPSEKTPPLSTISLPSDNSPLDLSIMPSPLTALNQAHTTSSSTGLSSPQKHALTALSNNSLLKKRNTRRAWVTSKKALSSWKPTSLGTLIPSPNPQMATLRMGSFPTLPSPVVMVSPIQPSGSSNLTMAVLPAIQRKMVLTTSPMSARFMRHPSTQLTLQSLYPIGSMKPFKGWLLATLSSLMQSRAQMIGASKLTLHSTEILTNTSSTTKPSLTTSTASSRAPSLPVISVRAGWNVCNFLNGFHIWWENPCICPPTNVLMRDGRKDRDITSKGEHDVIDLTIEDSSDDDKEL